MNRLIPACIETACAAIFLVPFYLYLFKIKFQSGKTAVTAFLFALYLCTVYTVVGLPNIIYIRFYPNFNFVPFQYFFSDKSTVLNVLLFVPLGLFLPILRTKFQRIGPTVLLGLLMSFFIEFFQIFTMRATDINDLFTNTLGTILGYLLGKWILKRFPSLILSEQPNELKTIFLSVILVMFFLQPFSEILIRGIIL